MTKYMTEDEIVRQSGALKETLVKKEEVMTQKKAIYDYYKRISDQVMKYLPNAADNLSAAIEELGAKGTWETPGGLMTQAQLGKIRDTIMTYVKDIQTSFGGTEKYTDIPSEIKDAKEYKRLEDAPNPAKKENVIVPGGELL